VRRFTLVTLILLFVALIVVAALQINAARGPRKYPGPGVSITPSAPVTTP
jgi:hypothetical protein